MTIRLHVLTGGRAGTVARFRQGPVHLGRSPGAELQLHPSIDLAVSSRHAVLEEDADGWYVRDDHSTNGTLLNGRWVHGRVRLEEGDRLCLGGSGPLVRFELEHAREVWVSPLDDQEPVAASAEPAGSAVSRDGGPAAAFWTGRRWPAAAGLAGVGIATAIAAALVLPVLLDRDRREGEVRALSAQLDSLLQESRETIAGLRTRVDGLEDALARSRAEVQDLDAQLRGARASGDEARVSALERRLQEATLQLDLQSSAAGLDFAEVERLNSPALARLHVETPSGRVLTATAFAVRPDGLLLTNRHVVDGGRGEPEGPPRRIAVQFSDSEQVWPAELVARSGDTDLAALRVLNVRGDVPTIVGFNRRPDTLAAGTPLVVLGFPLGGSAPSGGGPPRATVGAGTLRAALATQLHIDGYGAPGASGSPVLDADGRLVGVLQGGEEREDGTTLVAVPSANTLRFLEEVAAAARSRGVPGRGAGGGGPGR